MCRFDGKVLWTRSVSAGLVLLVLQACRGGGVASGEDIRIGSIDNVAGCENRGSTHVTLTSRDREASPAGDGGEAQLLSLARNSASQLGGNVLVPMTPVQDGGQSYAIFLCDH